MELGYLIDIIYIDFGKAFDQQNYQILLIKLEKRGLNNRVINGIRSDIINEYQYVKFGLSNTENNFF